VGLQGRRALPVRVKDFSNLDSYLSVWQLDGKFRCLAIMDRSDDTFRTEEGLQERAFARFTGLRVAHVCFP
jgi:hypothetical protein